MASVIASSGQEGTCFTSSRTLASHLACGQHWAYKATHHLSQFFPHQLSSFLIHGIQLSQLSSEIVPSSHASQGFSGQTVGAADVTPGNGLLVVGLEEGLSLEETVGVGVASAAAGGAVRLSVGRGGGLFVGISLGDTVGLGVASDPTGRAVVLSVGEGVGLLEGTSVRG